MRHAPSSASTRSGSAAVSMLALLGGIGFIVAWLAAAVVWFLMSTMAGAMANDAGRVSAGRHATLLIVLMVGELVVAIAGIVGGCAFFLPDLRVTLWWSFAGLVAAGAALQVWAMWAFVSAAA